MVKRWLCAIALASAASLATLSPAAASCAGPPNLAVQLQSAPVAFVGTVVTTADSGRQARVRVESIWKGQVLPLYVDVDGSSVSGSTAVSSVDRHYQVGQRYLFVPVSEQRPFQDNSCTATRAYTSALASYAPAAAGSPDPALASDPELPVGPWPLIWWAFGATAVLAGAVVMLAWLLARRRGRRRPPTAHKGYPGRA